MDVFECIKTRRSIRKYKRIPVEWDKVGRIMEAGKAAPSSGNIQNWKFIVCLDEPKRKAIAECCLNQNWMAQAPVHILVVAVQDKAQRFYGIRGEKLYSVQNCAAAIENMLLMAHALGLGACWVGAFDEEKLRTVVTMPNEIRPQAVLTIGYPDEAPPEPLEYTMENVMYFRDFGGQGNRIKDVNVYAGYTSARVQDAISKGKDILKKVGEKLQRK